MKKLKFHNPYHNGDIHLSRGLVATLRNYFEVSFAHDCSSRLLDDLCPTIREPIDPRRLPLEEDADGSLLMNTWFCQPQNRGANEIHLLNLWRTFKGSRIGPCLEYPKDLIPPAYPGLPPFLDRRSVLLCTNKVESLQCSNFSRRDLYQSIIDCYFSEVDFYVTNKYFLDYGTLKNVIFLDDLYPLRKGKDDQHHQTNLPEISKLSEVCQIIVGGGSGPYEVTKVDENLLNSKKVFICHSIRHFDVLWADPIAQARGYWTRDDSYLLETILHREIRKLLE